MTTLNVDVETALGELSEQLGTLESDLSVGLGALDQELNGPLAHQWNITAVTDYGSQSESYFDIPVTVASLVRWSGMLDYAKSWRPRQWEMLQTVVPYTTPGALIYSWTYGENPDAQEARQNYNDNLPQFQATTEATVRDVESLIELPRKLGRFYTQWDAARANMDSVPGRIDEALQLERTGLTWAGPGYESYRAVATKQQDISQAVRDGINHALEDVVGFVDLSLDVVRTLQSAAETLKSGVTSASTNLLKIIMNPKDWVGVVSLLIDCFAEGDRLRKDAAMAGVESLANIIERSATIDQHFSALRGAAGVSSLAEVSWPKPSSDVELSWDPTHRT